MKPAGQDKANPFTGQPLDAEAQRLNDSAMASAFGSKLSHEAAEVFGPDHLANLKSAGLDLANYAGKSKFVADVILVLNEVADLPKSQAAADQIKKSLSKLDLPESPSDEEVAMVEALTFALVKWDEQPQRLAGGGGIGSFFGGLAQGFDDGMNLSIKRRAAQDRRNLMNELKKIASTEAEDAGMGLKVTGGGEVASTDADTAKMMANQEWDIRAFNGNTSPVAPAPMVNFGGDLIKTDGPMDGGQVDMLRMNKMTGAALSNWAGQPRRYADGGVVIEDEDDGTVKAGEGEMSSKDADTEFVSAFNGTPAPAEEKPVDIGGFQSGAHFDGDQLRKLRLEKMTEAAMRYGDYDVAAKLSQTRLNALKLDESERDATDKKELRNSLMTFGVTPRSQYASRVAPKVVQTYLQQGNAAGAEAFQKFIDSMEGRRYSNRWDRIMKTYAQGDFGAALPLITELYNDSYPDGHQARITPLGDGRYRFEHIDESGTVVGSGEGCAKELADMGVFTLSPEKRVELTSRSQADDAKARRQLAIEDLRQDRQDARLDRRLAAGSGGGGLTVPQQRKNEEIKAARRQLTGMSQEDLLRRTQSTTNTGRTNPDYDSQLVSLARLANSRMYGEDPDFDAFQRGAAKQAPATSPTKPAAATKPTYNTTLKDQVDARRRFRDSPEVKDYALGKWVPGEGFEVLDKAGNHIGHFD